MPLRAGGWSNFCRPRTNVRDSGPFYRPQVISCKGFTVGSFWPKAICHRSLGHRPCRYPHLDLNFEFACNAYIHVEFFPSSPECNPAGFTIGFSTEESAEFGHASVKLSNGHVTDSVYSLACVLEHLQPDTRNHSLCRNVWIRSRKGLQLEQPNSNHAGKTNQRLKSTARFQLM